MRGFFAKSDLVDHMVLRPLSHIKGNWELMWDDGQQAYRKEDDSYAVELNMLIDDLGRSIPPERYHDSEDRLAEYVRDNLKWPVSKVGNRWIGADYASILEQGGFCDIDEENLFLAASGRIYAAKIRDQNHFDDMEDLHQKMLAAVLSIILYHRSE